MKILKPRKIFAICFIGAGVLAIGGLVIASWATWPFMMSLIFSEAASEELAQRGQFGDSFGALNTLFTGLAFVGLSFTIFIQIYERHERDEERAQEKREKYAANFEERFFRLNDSLRRVVASMSTTEQISGGTTERNGKDVFAVYVKEVVNAANYLVSSAPEIAQVDRLRRKYAEVLEKRRDHLEPYFRVLYLILRYVDRSEIPNKIEFTDIVRVELSPSELRLVALHCVSDGGAILKALVERYHLLKNLPDDEHKLNRSLFGRLFGREAFDGDSDEPELPEAPARRP